MKLLSPIKRVETPPEKRHSSYGASEADTSLTRADDYAPVVEIGQLDDGVFDVPFVGK